MITRLLVLSVFGLLNFAVFANDDVDDVVSTINADDLLIADNPRKDRRDDRQEDRQGNRDDKQDCRQEEGRAGHDKRECKQEKRGEGDENDSAEDDKDDAADA
jgi:hypothetical protein